MSSEPNASIVVSGNADDDLMIRIESSEIRISDAKAMPAPEKARLGAKIQGMIGSISSSLATLKGDSRVRASDKLRHCNRFMDRFLPCLDGEARRIMDELLSAEATAAAGAPEELPRSGPVTFIKLEGVEYRLEDVLGWSRGDIESLADRIDDVIESIDAGIDRMSGEVKIRALDKKKYCKAFVAELDRHLDYYYSGRTSPAGDVPAPPAPPPPPTPETTPCLPSSRPPPPMAPPPPPNPSAWSAVVPLKIHEHVRNERDQLRKSLDQLLDAIRSRLPPELASEIVSDAKIG